MLAVDLFSDPDTMARAGSTLPLGSDGRTAAQTATLFPQELAEMKHLLKADLARLPVDRFNGTDSELMRFAHAAGLRKVSCSMLCSMWPAQDCRRAAWLPPQKDQDVIGYGSTQPEPPGAW